MYLSQLNANDLNYALINKIIFENLNDDGLNGDIILVFGSITAPVYRVPRAVELLKAGRAHKIVMSGGQSDPPEAQFMKEAAIKLGAHESDIWLESKSKNTKENILFTKSLLVENYGLKILNECYWSQTFFI